MNWEQRILRDTDLPGDFGDRYRSGLADRISALMAHQKAHWPLLREGYKALALVVSKRIPLGNYEIFAQFNPRRMGSTAAQIDRASIESRPCFLCAENLPAEEKGVAFGEDWVVLCNPFPILDTHLSIVHRRHIPQAIAGKFESLLDLTKELGGTYFVSYNGPKCGASAPDHLHYQACSRLGLPVDGHLRAIETRAMGRSSKLLVTETPELELFTLSNYHIRLLVYRSCDRDAIAGWVYRTLEYLRKLTSYDREPLINLTAVYDSPAWTVCLFPRAKHRPACYYAEGEDRLTISPASIDLAGFLVLPIEEHFQRIGASEAQKLFAEVTLSPRVFADLLTELRKASGTSG